MALPIVTTYARYKSMQDDFANFLGQTGRLCQAPSHLLQKPEDPQEKDASAQLNTDDGPHRKGRPKGKERKVAQAKANPEASTKAKDTKTHKLYVNNYVSLAQHVATSKSVHAIIPAWIMTTLISIIRDREETLNHYKGADATLQSFCNTEELRRDNETHEHMINVLRQVHVILHAKHRDDEKRQAAKAAKVPTQHSNTLNSGPVNKFPQSLNTDEDELEEEETLDGAELDEQREADASAWKAANSAKTSIQFEANVDVSFADALRALKGLLEEWHSMRAKVKEAWKGYTDGSIDLGAAAIMANTAIDLARHLEVAVRPVIARNDELCRQGAWKDFLDRLPSSEGPASNIYSGLFHVLLTTSSQGINAACSTANDSKCADVRPLGQADMAKYVDFWFIESFKVVEARHKLHLFGRETLERDCILQGINGVRTEPQKPQEPPPELQEFQEPQRTVYQDIMELTIFGRCTKYFHFNFVDEVARAMYMSVTEPEFRLWTAFAWQLFRDAEELRNPQHPTQAFDELQDYLESVDGLLVDIKDDAAEKVHPPGYAKRMDVLLKDVLKRTSHIRTDVVETIGMKYGLVRTVPGIKKHQPFCLLRRHPIFCGLALQSIRFCMHELGTRLENSGTKALMCMAHLYNMCRVDAKTKKSGSDWQDWNSAGAWEDMERLVLSLQPRNVFIGGTAPVTGAECSRNFTLVTGMPVGNISVCHRNQKTPMAASREQILKDMKPKGKKAGQHKSVCFIGNALYPVSSKFATRLMSHDDRRDFTVEDLRRLVEEDEEKKDATRHKRGTAAIARHQQPSELLVELLTRLDQEAAILKCCSPRLFLDCLHLIRDIDDALKPHLDVEAITGLPSKSSKKTTGVGHQLPEMRLFAVLSRCVEFLPIARRVLIRWLKSNGGNGAVSFPKPPSGKES